MTVFSCGECGWDAPEFDPDDALGGFAALVAAVSHAHARHGLGLEEGAEVLRAAVEKLRGRL